MEQIPDVEGHHTTQSKRSSPLLTTPSHSQTHANANRPEDQTNPLLKRRPWAAALHDLPGSEYEDNHYAESAPYTSNPARYECDRSGRHSLSSLLKERSAEPALRLYAPIYPPERDIASECTISLNTRPRCS